MKTYKISQINEKRILGRTNFGGGDSYVGSAVLSAGAVTSSKDEPLALFWAASALEFSVRAASVWVELSSEYHSNEPWVSVYKSWAMNRFGSRPLSALKSRATTSSRRLRWRVHTT